MGKPRTIRSEKAHQTGISRIMKTSMHCDPNLSKSQSLGLCDLADAQGFRASAEPPWRLRALLGTPTWVQLHLGIERHILNNRNDRRKSHDMFFFAFLRFPAIFHSCSVLQDIMYLHLQIKGKGDTKKVMEDPEIHVQPARCKSGCKAAAKIGQSDGPTLRVPLDIGNGEDMWRIWWFHPDRFCANCNLKQDLSDFTPALVMGES